MQRNRNFYNALFQVACVHWLIVWLVYWSEKSFVWNEQSKWHECIHWSDMDLVSHLANRTVLYFNLMFHLWRKQNGHISICTVMHQEIFKWISAYDFISSNVSDIVREAIVCILVLFNFWIALRDDNWFFFVFTYSLRSLFMNSFFLHCMLYYICISLASTE